MFHPLELIPSNRRCVVVISLLIATVISMAAVWLANVPLLQSESPLGVISPSQSFEVETTRKIVGSWSPTQRIYASFGLGLDFLNLVVYSITLSCLCYHLASLLHSSFVTMARFGYLLAWLQFVAMIADAIENLLLLRIIIDIDQATWALALFVSSMVKIGLVVAAILWIVVAWILHCYSNRIATS